MKKDKPVALTPPVPTDEEFIAALRRGMEGIESACKMIAAILAHDPRRIYSIRDKCPEVTLNMLGSMERVGLNRMHPALLFDNSPAANRLRKAPVEKQKAAYDKPVAVVSVIGGKYVVEEKNVQSLNKKQAVVTIAPDGELRTSEQQIAIIKAAPLVVVHTAERYKVEGDKLVVYAKTTFNLETLRNVVTRLEAAALAALPAQMKANQAAR